MKTRHWNLGRGFGFAAGLAALATVCLAAGDPAGTASVPSAVDARAMGDVRTGLDAVWVLVAAMLVLWMNAGFALLESGLCRAKNCVNVLAKNFIVFALATVVFYLVGWGLMFGDGNSFVGTSGLWFAGGPDNSPALATAFAMRNPFSAEVYSGVYSSLAWAAVPLWAKFILHVGYAAVAATIISGAVAERMKFSTFVIFAGVFVAVIYPVAGHWIWGGGFLAAAGFRDFAGSTVIHSAGGWATLAAVIVLGPRLGKYREGRVYPIPGHNMTSAALGAMILWFGWLGFTSGSTMSVGNGSAIAHILVATNMGAAFGALGATATAWLLLRKPDLSMIITGCLGGLVAVTGACGFVTVTSACEIGLIAGVLAVLGVIFFDKLKLDDPVGALAVHLLNGVFGSLALGIFYDETIATVVAGKPTGLSMAAQTLAQAKGVLCVGLWAFPVSLAVWFLLKATVGIRVTPEEEHGGLDLSEHGNEAYPDFQAAHK